MVIEAATLPPATRRRRRGHAGWLRQESKRIHAAAGGDRQLLEVLAWAAVLAQEEQRGQ